MGGNVHQSDKDKLKATTDIKTNTAKDGTGTSLYPITDSNGHLQVDILSAVLSLALSNITIDIDKDWQGYNITNLGAGGHNLNTLLGYLDQDVTITATPTFAGGTINGAVLIDGSANVVQLVIKGHSTQTANLLQLKNNAGTVTYYIDSSSRMRVGLPPEGYTEPNSYGSLIAYAARAGIRLVASAASSSTGGAGILCYSDDGAPMASEHRLGFILFGGAKTTSDYGHGAGIAAYATENWTNTAIGSLFAFETVPNGSTTRAKRLVVGNDGKIGIGSSTTLTSPLDVQDNRIRIRTAKTPTTAGDSGAQGEICWDADYIYVCVATNTWKRAAIATW